jgi:hypothetical protein
MAVALLLSAAQLPVQSMLLWSGLLSFTAASLVPTLTQSVAEFKAARDLNAGST